MGDLLLLFRRSPMYIL